MEMTKRVKCESCGGKGMIIPKKHGGMVVPRKCEHCNGTGTTEAPITNADRIRAMSDEELARHLHCIGWDCHLCAEHMRIDNEPLLRNEKCDENCFEHCLEWLKQPAEVKDNA